jgi:hypothetical protein
MPLRLVLLSTVVALALPAAAPAQPAAVVDGVAIEASAVDAEAARLRAVNELDRRAARRFALIDLVRAEWVCALGRGAPA